MYLNNNDFFDPILNSSGEIPYFGCSGNFINLGLKPKKLYQTCSYCHSDIEVEALRCNSCGAPKNSYNYKERN